jgi:hypothetical protein
VGRAYRFAKPSFIVLHRIAYGPEGFTCSCGGKEFKKTQREDDTPTPRSSRQCKKCQVSYIFVSRMFSKETAL